jgi:ABC-2 type transport system ATP-binding protein
MAIIEVKNLIKEFNKFRAVDNVSFKVERGEIFGLLGPNGAGKTTTIRMLTGILEPTEGEVYIGQYNIQENPTEAKQKMGIVPEMANPYIDLSAQRNLLLMGELYGIEKNKSIKKAENLLEIFRLHQKRNQKVRTFSKGMKQRLILAMALMNNSEILLLDEPTGGLDIDSVRIIRDLIRKFNQKGVTVFLTTHNIEEANLLCDRVAIMNYGKIVAIDRPEKLKDAIQSTSSIEVAFKEKINQKDLEFAGIIKVKKVGDKFKLYGYEIENFIPLLVKHAQDSGNKILSLKTLGPSLEDVFIRLTKSKENEHSETI